MNSQMCLMYGVAWSKDEACGVPPVTRQTYRRLTYKETDRSSLCILECMPPPTDEIQVCLKSGWDCEVIHRVTEHYDIRRLQLGDELI